ncbi:MAG: alpha/beta fold hydrolase [Proteobacteria bacterium]|nr:alpha/beta fold hydrolase [Pseudomonadota bacterium]
MLMTLLILFCLAILSVSVVTYGLFWRQTSGTAHLEMLREASHGRPWLWVGAGFLSSLASQAGAVLLYPLFLVKPLWLGSDIAPPNQSSTSNDKPTVLFVHGYAHTAAAWVFYAAWFRRAGYSDLHAITYNSWKLDFWGIVKQLERETEAILRERPGQKIVLVCHSLGGLAARTLLNTSELRQRVLAVVTLGTPHQGTTLASIGMNDLAHKLEYRGQLIKEIEASDIPSGVPSLAIYSLVDNMVMPLEGLRINKEGWQEFCTAPICHVGLLYHQPTAKAALSFIAQAVSQTKGNQVPHRRP